MAGKEERAAPPKTQRKDETIRDVPLRQVLGTARGGEAGPRRASEAKEGFGRRHSFPYAGKGRMRRGRGGEGGTRAAEAS